VVDAKAILVKTLLCTCGGEFEPCDLPKEGTEVAHRCASCGFVGYVRGQTFPGVTRWPVQVRGITE